jgi:hypothetical protein
MSTLTLDEVTAIAATSNTSILLSVQTLTCIIWKESGFVADARNSRSSATGLLQMTKDAVTDVNNNSPKGVHFRHADMATPALNIQCGSRYLDLRIRAAGGDIRRGIESFGTGSGYASNIIACANCLTKLKDGKTEDQRRPCLFAIHP